MCPKNCSRKKGLIQKLVRTKKKISANFGEQKIGQKKLDKKIFGKKKFWVNKTFGKKNCLVKNLW